MAGFTFKGMDDYIAELNKLGKSTKEIIGTGVYAMANEVANNVKRNIGGLNAISDVRAIIAWKKQEPSGLTERQKKGLLDSFGISPMRNDNGYYHVKLGFDGYNDVKTKKYPNGQPNAMIARSVESGTSFMQKHPFMRPAVEAAKQSAVEAGKKAVDEKIYSLIK